MRVFSFIILVYLFLILTNGEENSLNGTDLLSEAPQCAVSLYLLLFEGKADAMQTGCAQEALLSSPTVLIDLQASCNNATLLEAFTICILESCTPSDQQSMAPTPFSDIKPR